MKNNKCPICKSENESKQEFCSNCYWELIYIPEGANSALKKYYEDRVSFHKTSYDDLMQKSSSLINAEKELKKNKTERTDLLQEIELNNNVIDRQKSKIENSIPINEKLIEYQERYGDTIIQIDNQIKKNIIYISWAINDNTIFLSSEKSLFPAQILVLLDERRRSPQIGNFQLAIRGNVLEGGKVELSKNGISEGHYFIQLISISNKTTNYIFKSEEKSKSSTQYDESKVKIIVS